MSRTWQRPNGTVYFDENDSEAYARTMGYTEVRIVPADAIVIERSELPAVTERPNGYVECGGLSWLRSTSIDKRRENALQELAVMEFQVSNPLAPPVDESQVAAVQAVIDSLDADDFDDLTLARRLVQNGLRVEGVTS